MIPFNRASIVGNELSYIGKSVASGIISGEGCFGRRCEQELAKRLGATSRVLITSSCTHALEMCALLLDVQPGDEIIVPSYTFVSTANAFALRGAKVVFADIEPATMNICPESIASLISKKTKAVVVVHYGGVACDMERIVGIAEAAGVCVVEDAAHALGASYNGHPLGSIGQLATFSFHETKNITCGEGGALVVNHSSFDERAYILRDKGTNRREFQRGEAEFYTWVDYGSSYVMSDLLAAFLYAQLEFLDVVTEKRRDLYRRYVSGLAELRSRECVLYPDHVNVAESSAHLFFIVVPTPSLRLELQEYLKANGVLSVFHYQPLHLSPFCHNQDWTLQSLPNTEYAAPRLLRLPLYASLTHAEQDVIIELLHTFFREGR